MQHLAILVLLALLLSGCQTITSRENVERTVAYGRAYLPAKATVHGEEVMYRGAALEKAPFVGEVGAPGGYREFRTSWMEEAARLIKPGTRWPVVVHLHGCRGYVSTEDADFPATYLAMDAIVVLPNSLARVGRDPLCNQGTQGYRSLLRHAEASLALAQLRARPWVDAERIVLAGFSEGGQAVVSFSEPGFTAHIAMGTNCRHNNGSVSAPRGVPVLVIKGEQDALYGGDHVCTVPADERGSRYLIIPEAGHGVGGHPEARAAIHDFLRRCCEIGA